MVYEAQNDSWLPPASAKSSGLTSRHTHPFHFQFVYYNPQHEVQLVHTHWVHRFVYSGYTNAFVSRNTYSKSHVICLYILILFHVLFTFISIYFQLCVCVCACIHTCMYTYIHTHVYMSIDTQVGLDSHGAEVTGNAAWHGYWKPNLVLLQEKFVLLGPELSLVQP